MTEPESTEEKPRSRRKSYRTPESNADIQCAIMIAAGWSVGEVAKFLGCSHVAIVQRRKRHPETFRTVGEWTRLAIDRYIAQQLRDKDDEIAEIKKKIHNKAYRVVDKSLNHALALPDEEMPQKEHLLAAEMAIDRNEGKAIDRKSIEQRSLNVNATVDISVSTLDDVLREVSALNEMRKKALPPSQIEAIEASSTNGALVAELLD